MQSENPSKFYSVLTYSTNEPKLQREIILNNIYLREKVIIDFKLSLDVQYVNQYTEKKN